MRMQQDGYFSGSSRWQAGGPGDYKFVARLLIYLFLLVFLLKECLGESMGSAPSVVLVADRSAELKRLRTDLLGSYVKLTAPTSGNKKIPVKIFFDTQYVVSLDEKYQIITIKGILMMQWTDQRLAWSPDSYSGIKGLHFSPKEIWLPEIHSLYNVKSMDLSDIPTPANVYNNGSVKWYAPVVFDVPCSAQYKHYPFDSHNCSIALATWHFSIIDLVLLKTESSQSSLVQSTEWTVTRIDQEKIARGDVWSFEGNHIRVTLFLERASRIYRYICVIPTLVCMVSLLFGFWLLPNETSRYLVGCCNIIVLSMLLQHLAVTVPAGKVVPLLAQYCASCLCLSTIFILLTVLINRVRESSGMPPSGLVRLAYFAVDRYLCLFAFSHVSGGNKMADEAANPLPDEVRRRKDWYCLAVMFDRIAFWCFVFIFAVLLAVLAAI